MWLACRRRCGANGSQRGLLSSLVSQGAMVILVAVEPYPTGGFCPAAGLLFALAGITALLARWLAGPCAHPG